MLGEIYLIENDINDKIYIGKTLKSTEYRFREHIRDAFMYRDRDANNKFYNALRKYGAEHFRARCIGKFNADELNDMEIYYIKKYNSYKNGYNSTLGGDGTTTLSFDDETIKNILVKYRNGESIVKIASFYNVSTFSISNILRKMGINTGERATKPKKIVMCDDSYNHIKLYESIMDAVIDFGMDYSKTGTRNFYNAVNKACKECTTAYEYRWQYYNDLIYDGKLFRSIKDIDNFKLGGTLIQNENGMYITDISIKGSEKTYESESITCQELNIVFNSLDDAIYWLIQNGKKKKNTNIRAGRYALRQARDRGGTYFGYHWI